MTARHKPATILIYHTPEGGEAVKFFHRPKLRTVNIPTPIQILPIIQLSPGIELEVIRETSQGTQVNLHGVCGIAHRLLIDRRGWEQLAKEAERYIRSHS